MLSNSVGYSRSKVRVLHMVKVWNHITRMIHDDHSIVLCLELKTGCGIQHGGWGVFGPNLDEWRPRALLRVDIRFDRISLRAASSHKATPGTWRQHAEWRDMEDCGTAFFIYLYIPIIYQCVGDYWGKEALVLMLFFGGNFGQRVRFAAVMLCDCLFFQSFPGLPLQGYNSLLVMWQALRPWGVTYFRIAR